MWFLCTIRSDNGLPLQKTFIVSLNVPLRQNKNFPSVLAACLCNAGVHKTRFFPVDNHKVVLYIISEWFDGSVAAWALWLQEKTESCSVYDQRVECLRVWVSDFKRIWGDILASLWHLRFLERCGGGGMEWNINNNRGHVCGRTLEGSVDSFQPQSLKSYR